VHRGKRIPEHIEQMKNTAEMRRERRERT